MKKLLFIGALVALIAFIAQKAKEDRERWQGLSEDDVRERLDHRLPNQIPDEKRQAIADTIVTKMKDRGALTDDTIDAEAPIDLAEDADEAIEESATA